MNRFFFRELLEDDPKLLLEMIAFNRTEAWSDEAVLAVVPPGLRSAVLREPVLVAALRRAAIRHRPRPPEGCWDFTEESRRMAFLSAGELSRLGRLMAAAVLAEDHARLLARDAVLELRRSVGEDVIDYALARGRWQVGGLRQRLRAFAPAGRPGERTLVLARTMLEIVRAGWPEELRNRTVPLFASLDLPPVKVLPDVDDALRRDLWHFTRKIILRELEPECRRVFS